MRNGKSPTSRNVPPPDDPDLLSQWEATVHGTVVALVTSYRAVPEASAREILADAQIAIAECGNRLNGCVARIRGEGVRRG